MVTIAKKPATKEQSYLRLALWGPSGSGKTYTALKLATAIGGKVAALDTERSSMRKYADLFSFYPIEGLASNDPRSFAEVIWLAAEEEFDVLVLDTISPAWSGPGGATSLNDQIATERYSGNTFRAWQDTNQIIDVLLRAILEAPIHIIATMRAKTVYAQEESEDGGRRRTYMHKLGQAPEQRQNVEHEFDIVGSLDDSVLTVTKTRFSDIRGIVVSEPGEAFIRPIMEWLAAGEERVVPPAAPAEEVARLIGLLTEEGFDTRQIQDVFRRIRSEHGGVLPAEWVEEKIAAAEERKEAAPAPQEAVSGPEAPESGKDAPDTPVGAEKAAPPPTAASDEAAPADHTEEAKPKRQKKTETQEAIPDA